jgi:hypothetical protein
LAISKRNAVGKPVRSLAEYLEAVDNYVGELAPSRDFFPWFRGHPDGTWRLVPGYYRAGNDEAVDEDDFRYDFRRKAWPYLAGVAHEPANDWEWYFLMQHQGLPTRLLDWSASALVALYFALGDKPSTENPCVWVLNPFALNRRIAKRGDVILSPGDGAIKRYLPEEFSSAALPDFPAAIEAPIKSARIAAQRGVFTIHGLKKKPLDDYADLRPNLKKIDIARSAVNAMRDQMYVAGYSETTVFPELPALCRELVDYWKVREG